MTCNEVSELISAAVDGELVEDLQPQVANHLDGCQSCRHEYELELMTKSILRKRIESSRAPRALVENVRRRLAAEVAQREVISTVVNPVRRLPWQAMVALGGACAVVLLLLMITPSKSHHSHAQPDDGNIVHQTYNNFDGVLNGKMVPEISSTDPAIIKAFFKTKTNFCANVPHLKRCKLVGALCSEYKKEPVAHLLYNQDGDMIYLYQTRLQTVSNGATLQLPTEIMSELHRTGWYFENHMPDCTLMMWIVDSTICCAVADIRKDKLLASFTESE